VAEPHWQRVDALFAEALELPLEGRAALLERAAAEDPALRREVESLLEAHAVQGGILDGPADALAEAAPPEPAPVAAGTHLGSWRLGELLGRGGAGEVYRAERDEGGFAQVAAIKLLRPEAAGELERFHAERRLLARLEHPAIARILDGGVAADGRPYTVLEYVEGRPITEACRARRLGLSARLELFREVCEAVDFAHRNLVVHRDLKPGNILVGRDGRVKLLDFGIAKLLDEGGAREETWAPITPDYAAPEQLTGEPVTTATDLWGLGVVLFELLSDERPFPSAGLPLAAALRSRLEREAPQLSAVVAARAARGETVPVPPRALAGDLDAIVALCLRREPRQRYASAAELARDLERHLADRPVRARAGLRRYVAGRFVRRHRWAVGAVATVVVALLAGIVAFAGQARRAERAADIARRAASREEALRYSLVNLFRESLAPAAGAGAVTAKSMLDRSAQRVLDQYRDDPLLAGRVVETLADLYGALQDVEGQAPLLEGFLERAGPEADPRAVAVARQKLAQLELARGRPERAGELLAAAEAFWESDPERWIEPRLEGRFVRGLLLRTQGDLAGSIAAYETAIPERVRLSGRDHRETANLYNSLAITLTAAGRNEEALAAYREALGIHQRLGRGEEVDALILLANSGTLAYRTGRIREAEEILERAWRGQRATAGDSAAVAAAMGLWGAAATVRGRAAAAVAPLREAEAMAVRFAGEPSPLAIQDRIFLADALVATGEGTEAAGLLERALGLAHERYGEAHLLTLRARLARARLDLAAGRAAAAAADLEALLPPLAAAGPQGQSWVAHAQLALGDARLALGRPLEAAAAFEEAVRLRESLLWNGSAELALARARLGEARLAGEVAGGRDLIAAALPALRAELGESHAETRRAEKLLS
jgi:non-specific serine/threonine protein kinase/serine/threonine-protein kinase